VLLALVPMLCQVRQVHIYLLFIYMKAPKL